MKSTNYYMEKLRKGEAITIACINYELHITYIDGKYHCWAWGCNVRERFKEMTKEQVRNAIDHARLNSSDYTCYVGGI